MKRHSGRDPESRNDRRLDSGFRRNDELINLLLHD